MATGGRSARVKQNELNRLVRSPTGPIGRLILSVIQEVGQEAKRRAPVGARSGKLPGSRPSGYLRSQIEWEVKVGSEGIVGIVRSPATTSVNSNHPGSPYGLYNEVPSLRPYGIPGEWRAKEGPYLRPALEAVLARRFGSLRR